MPWISLNDELPPVNEWVCGWVSGYVTEGGAAVIIKRNTAGMFSCQRGPIKKSQISHWMRIAPPEE